MRRMPSRRCWASCRGRSMRRFGRGGRGGAGVERARGLRRRRGGSWRCCGSWSGCFRESGIRRGVGSWAEDGLRVWLTAVDRPNLRKIDAQYKKYYTFNGLEIKQAGSRSPTHQPDHPVLSPHLRHPFFYTFTISTKRPIKKNIKNKTEQTPIC
jgi:hypothetical protein